MGLDMYLKKKTYVWSDEREKGFIITGLKSKINPKRVSFIIEEIGYWRKANAIHKWFVEHVQEGEDDCKEHYVSKEQLQELLDTVNKVLKASKLKPAIIQNGYRSQNGKTEAIYEEGKTIANAKAAEKLLPTTEGFFFGSTSYDQYYYQDLVETKRILEEALKEDDDAEYFYESSW